MLNAVFTRTFSIGTAFPNIASVSFFIGPLINPDAERGRLQARHRWINKSTRLARLATQIFIRELTMVSCVILNELFNFSKP